MGQHYVLSSLPPVTMITAPNPGPMTLSGTNTYVIGSGTAYVVDPGPDMEEHIQDVMQLLRHSSSKPAGILLTHGHADHTGGARALSQALAIPVWASGWMSREARNRAGVTCTYSQGKRLPLEHGSIEVIDTPGHTRDHVALWVPEERVLFVGDSILGEGSTLIQPPEGDMLEYMRSLEVLDALDARIMAPGHGPVITDPPTKIAEYVEHRRSREEQLLQVLKETPLDVTTIVARVYADVDPVVREIAAGSVQAQLDKLVKEGRVVQRGPRFELRE
jgi:glyoxylase-like metal-dependent hydrolase (beta-lactamase superfamily II)